MSPEQVSGGELDARSDVFSVGIVLAEMVMARRLFTATNELDVLLMVRDARLERLHKYAAEFPVELRVLDGRARCSAGPRIAGRRAGAVPRRARRVDPRATTRVDARDLAALDRPRRSTRRPPISRAASQRAQIDDAERAVGPDDADEHGAAPRPRRSRRAREFIAGDGGADRRRPATRARAATITRRRGRRRRREARRAAVGAARGRRPARACRCCASSTGSRRRKAHRHARARGPRRRAQGGVLRSTASRSSSTRTSRASGSATS